MRLLWFALVMLLCVVPPALAQDGGDTPDPAQACGDLAPNEVCYGQASVELMTDCEDAPDFDTAGDRASATQVCMLRTSGEGVAFVHLRPDEASAYMIATGDVEMQNVSSGRVGLEVTLTEDIDILAGPGSQYEVIGTLEAGTVVFVNACNCTRNWLRIMQDDGSVAWIPARRVDIGDADLPEVDPDTPVFAAMQAFRLVTGDASSGLLIQMAADTDTEPLPLQINGVLLHITATAFVRSLPGERMEIDVIEGEVRLESDTMTARVPAGGHILLPLDANSLPTGAMSIAMVEPDHIAGLPLTLAPRPVEPGLGLAGTEPVIVGVEACSVVSDLGGEQCPVHFLNPDGDAIALLDAEFVYAPIGTWEGSRHADPPLLDGDATAGRLAWEVSCSLAGENFIGPVEWLLTLQDADGNRSEPFPASFNCVDG